MSYNIRLDWCHSGLVGCRSYGVDIPPQTKAEVSVICIWLLLAEVVFWGLNRRTPRIWSEPLSSLHSATKNFPVWLSDLCFLPPELLTPSSVDILGVMNSSWTRNTVFHWMKPIVTYHQITMIVSRNLTASIFRESVHVRHFIRSYALISLSIVNRSGSW